MGDQLNLCKILNGGFIIGLVYQKKEGKTFMGFGFSASGTGGDKATAREEGPTENLTKPSRRRAEKDDKTREVFFFLFLFLLYFWGGGGSKLD